MTSVKVPSRLFLKRRRDGLLALGESFEAGAVDEEDIEPVVVIEVVEGDAAAGGFEQVSVLVLTAVDGFGVQSDLTCDVEEGDAERGTGDRGGEPFGCWTRYGIVGGARSRLLGWLGILQRCQGQNVVERKNQCCGGERGEKVTAGPIQKDTPRVIDPQPAFRGSLFDVVIVITKLDRVERVFEVAHVGDLLKARRCLESWRRWF